MAATYDSVRDLTAALRRAATAHARHEKMLGHEGPDWPGWYAQYMWDEQERHRSQRFARLPERVDAKDTVATHPVDPPRDPRGGRDTEQDFLLRYGAGGDDLWDATDG